MRICSTYYSVVSAILLGISIVLLGTMSLALPPGVKREDGIATAGLFGAVSGSTVAAAMVLLEEEKIPYEAWIPALYPFMDIPALILAIVLASLYHARRTGETQATVNAWTIIKDSLQGSALSALLLGLALGILTEPGKVYNSFYDPYNAPLPPPPSGGRRGRGDFYFADCYRSSC